MIFLVIPVFVILISSIYYFLFFNKSIRNNIIWLILIVILFSLISSLIFSASDRGSFDGFFLNLVQFTILSLFYAALLLGLHYFIIKVIGKIILVENYTKYILCFSFFSIFISFLYLFLLASIFNLE